MLLCHDICSDKNFIKKYFHRDAFMYALTEVNEKLEREKMELLTGKSSKTGAAGEKSSSGKIEWSTDELALLIKAVNLFPAGKKKTAL